MLIWKESLMRPKNESVKKWVGVKDRSILEKNHGKNLNIRTTKDPKEWACLADKKYEIRSLDDIENFSNRIFENLEKDWEPFIQDLKKLLN